MLTRQSITAMIKNMVAAVRDWFRHAWQRIHQELQWLTPGLGVKRWLFVTLAGISLLGVGVAMGILDFYRTAPDTWWLPAVSTLSLRFLARPLRVLIFGGIGVGLVFVGLWGMNRALLRPFIRPGRPVIEAISAFRRRERGPRIVVIGGGHGLSALLRGLKAYTHNLTAIVSVADDGGSSGELRRRMGVLPPGDIRNCLAALSNDEAMLAQVFQYRFAGGAGLDGHSLGNLFITALTELTGSFEEAVAESGRVLAVHGQVLPATLHDVRLSADINLPNDVNRVHIKGESEIPRQAGKVRRVWLEPSNATAFPPAIAAILSADLIVVGPGSIFTSLLPSLLVPDLVDAIQASKAVKFYVCNLATQRGETDGFTCGDHIHAIENHLRTHLFDLVICNNDQEALLPEGINWVEVEDGLEDEYALYQAKLADKNNPIHHDSSKLAEVVMDLFFEKTGPLAG
jgi:uncharacterized cofD-like protein